MAIILILQEVLWDFKRDEIVDNADVTNDDNAPAFKYKASLIGNTGNDGTKNGVKIVAPLKYLSNFSRSLEMPLINCKTELSLKWYEKCLLTVTNTATFKITDANLYVPIVIFSAEGNAKLSKLLGKGLKRPVCWNKYKAIDNKVVEVAAANGGKYIRQLLDSSWQGVKKDCLLLLMIIKKVIIKFLLILIKNIFFQDLK